MLGLAGRIFMGPEEVLWVCLMGDDISEHTTNFLWNHFAEPAADPANP
jgi:hypothetical protein